jgi:response regulator of citrate/malate metabolism
VITVTAARDVEVVRQAVAQGVVGYVIKPFTPRSFKIKIEQYLSYEPSWTANRPRWRSPTSTPGSQRCV